MLDTTGKIKDLKKHSTNSVEEQDSLNNPNERLARLVRLAARAFSRSLQIRLAKYNISFGQWIFLRILWQKDGLTQRDLSDLANLTEPTTHTALLKLASQGLITRRKMNGDKRRVYTFLTQSGLDLRDELEPMAIEVNRVAIEGLSVNQEILLRDALKQVIHNLELDEDESANQGRKMPPTRSNQDL